MVGGSQPGSECICEKWKDALEIDPFHLPRRTGKKDDYRALPPFQNQPRSSALGVFQDPGTPWHQGHETDIGLDSFVTSGLGPLFKPGNQLRVFLEGGIQEFGNSGSGQIIRGGTQASSKNDQIR